jgi:2-polyprenyl-3-methyl-5-hydroxy-6-metoxy-1,4-benzoquinol methylase
MLHGFHAYSPPCRFANGAESLLDFACGRGGDIWKWIDAGITVVKGIDLSPGEIEEARKR